MSENKFRSDLSIAKNLGSAASGSEHWWHQRFTAIILALSGFWLFWIIFELKTMGIIYVISAPYNLILFVIFTLTALYHSMLGMQVVIEDYVSCRIARATLLIFLQIFLMITAAAFIIAVVRMMTL